MCHFELIFFFLENFQKTACPGCRQNFWHSHTLGIHLKKSPSCQEVYLLAATEVQPVRKHRIRLTINQKCKVLDDLEALEKKEFPLAQSVVATKHNITPKNVSKWNSQKEELFYAREQGLGHHRSLVLASRVMFPDQEDKLYIAFVYRRRKQGLATPDDWLQRSMLKIIDVEKPTGYEDFKASGGWLWRFKKRYRISVQCQTNKKHVPISEKLHLIKKFHFWLLRKVVVGVQGLPARCVACRPRVVKPRENTNTV